MVAKVLHERGILDREPQSYQKQHWIGDRNIRAYTITARIFTSFDVETIDRAVRVDRPGTSEDGPTAENGNDPSALTTLTTLATQNGHRNRVQGR